MNKRLILLAPLALGACTSLGPKAETPVSLAPTSAGNASIEPINPATGEAQHFTEGAKVPAQWWTGFGSGDLNALVARALKANNDLAAADAALRQARALAGVAAADRLPTVDAGYGVTRAQVSNVISPPLADPNALLYTLHTSQVSLNYPLDVFGGVASKVKSARAAAAGQMWRTRAARTTVVSNLVLAVVQQAALADQITAQREAVTTGRGVLDMLRKRQALGAVGAADVAAQETQLAAVEGALPGLERAQLHQQAIIAALLGVAPGTALPPLPKLADLHLPQDLPVSVPSVLVAERPDVRAAQAAMQGAAADVGTAIAARLPALSLSANVGGAALSFGQMFADGNLFWALAGNVTQPLFHGGALLKQQHAAQAAFDASKAQYRASVLQAFVDVSDALAGLASDARALDAASRGDEAAARQLTFTTRQLELGGAGRLDLLNAQGTRAQAAATLVQARAARLSDTVALYQALGGGVSGL
ncbi:MAG: efflux transporter outer membrane subunit [Sphingomonadales bacterium]|nr:efflux transporter outer membrane subunit [Sphingomonadales bacterium]MDE2168031.1 efflux transporter outer membrane subunit [Sphingomonadales bacterium]